MGENEQKWVSDPMCAFVVSFLTNYTICLNGCGLRTEDNSRVILYAVWVSTVPGV